MWTWSQGRGPLDSDQSAQVAQPQDSAFGNPGMDVEVSGGPAGRQVAMSELCKVELLSVSGARRTGAEHSPQRAPSEAMCPELCPTDERLK